MPENIQSLENQLRDKRHELDKVSSALSGAVIGAALTKGSPLGILAGGALTRDKNKKEQLEREIRDLEGKLNATQDQISRLKSKLSDLMNTYQNDKARFDADARQKYNDVERQKYSTQDPTALRAIEDQLSKLRDTTHQQEQTRSQKYDQDIAAIEQEIHRLTA